MDDVVGIKERIIVGSSVCSYAIDPQHNCLYFLLGSEKKYPIWSESGKFSDFGGSLKHAEETAEECAVREWCEETCGVVRWDDSEPKGLFRSKTDPLVACLKNKEYTFKIKTLIEHNRCYVTFLKQCPFDATIMRTFEKVTKLLNEARNSISIGGVYVPQNEEEVRFFHDHPAATMDENGNVSHVNRCYTEKQSLQWVSLPQLKEAIARGERNGNESGMSDIMVLRDTFRWRCKLIIPRLENIKLMRWEQAKKIFQRPDKPC